MIYAIGALVSFIIFILIGLFVSRKVKNIDDYYVSGRNAPTIMILGSLIASHLSTVAFMGDVGFSYEGYAIPMLLMSAFVLPGYIIGALFFGRYLRRSESVTLPQFFGARFNSRAVRLVAAITLIIGITAYLVAVSQGAGLLLSEITGFSYPMALIIVILVFTTVTFSAGAKGVLLTDTLMFLLFTIATFLSIPYIFNAAGGYPEAIINAANLKEMPDLLSWHGITGAEAYMGTSTDVLLWCIIIGIVWGTVIAVSPWQSSRYLMAKNEHITIRSAILATIALASIYVVLHITIAAVNVINSSIEPTERVFIWSVMNLVPTWIGVLAVSGILAAALSSASTFLQLIGNSISKDLFKTDKISDKKLLTISRFMMIFVAIITLIFTLWQPPAVFWISIFAATLFAASWGPVAFTSILWKRVTKTGAFYSILFGTIAVIVTELLMQFNIVELPVYLNSAVFGGISSIIALVAGSLLTQPTAEEMSYRNKLLKMPEEEYNPKRVHITKKYPAILMTAGFIIIIFTLVIYYIPVYL
jgi:Na+/proline symporter